MDPLSFVASILTVIHGVHSSVQGIKKLNDCRRAPQELNRIRVELEGLADLLEDVRDYIGDAPSAAYCEALGMPVALASERINTVQQTIDSPSFPLFDLKDGNKARMTWLRHKRRLIVLADDIRNIKADIGLRLNLITA